jgi:Flp pilus assembly secretin CpaC
MPRAPLSALAFAAALALATPLAAQTMVVPIDHSTRLNVSGSAASVVVGNPQVADVTVVDSHTVFVSGRGYGQTDVVVLDGAGRTLYAGEVIVGSPTTYGQVSVYRGAARTDMACAPNCEVTFRSPTKGESSGSAGGAAGPIGASGASNPLAAMVGAMGNAVSAGANNVGRAVAPVAQ